MRIHTHRQRLIRIEHRCQLRLRAAERQVAEYRENPPFNRVSAECAADEMAEARTELGDVHERQSLALRAQDRHTDELPDGSILLVLNNRTGEQYVIERRDNNNPPESGTWYRIDDEDPMTFDTAIGVDEGYNGHEFYRLYTCEQVDDMLDRAGADDLFI